MMDSPEQISPGVHNLRDVGGALTRDGRRVRTGLLWRSSALLRADGEVAQRLASMGVVTVVDLRDEGERASSPTTPPGSLAWHSVPIFSNRLHALAWESLEDLYRQMVLEHAGALAQAVGLVADSVDKGGVLVHCTAGKDRTGVVTALVLDVVGVPRDDIRADYERSGDLLGHRYLADLGALHGRAPLTGLAAHAATASPGKLLDGAFDLIEEMAGEQGPQASRAFLRHHGVREAQLASLEQHLTEAL